MSGPAAVIVAGAATMWIAFHSTDGLVADDYYKQGLAINKRLAKEDEAQRLGISASVRFMPDRLHVDLWTAEREALLQKKVGEALAFRCTPYDAADEIVDDFRRRA